MQWVCKIGWAYHLLLSPFCKLFYPSTVCMYNILPLWTQKLYSLLKSFIGTLGRLVGQHWWWCMLITRGLATALDTSVDWTVGLRLGDLAAIPSASFVLAGACSLVGGLAAICVLCIAASLIYILHLLLTTFGVSITYEWEVSALERTSFLVDIFLVYGSCSLTGCLVRSLGSSLACISCHCPPVWSVVRP